MLPSAPKPSGITKRGTKLTPLPQNATISKRPLPRPALPSPYASSTTPKIVYISAKTPFLSAIKRVEKLLQKADKRVVQAATQKAQTSNTRKRKRDDEITAIAEEVEASKGRVEGEEVVVKGTGKAIARVMEVGCWFLEREGQFRVRLETGSVCGIDDVRWEEGEGGGKEEVEESRVRRVSVLEVHVSLK